MLLLLHYVFMNAYKLFNCNLPVFLAALHTTCTAESPNTACPTKALEVEDLSWLVDNNRLRSLGMGVRPSLAPRHQA